MMMSGNKGGGGRGGHFFQKALITKVQREEACTCNRPRSRTLMCGSCGYVMHNFRIHCPCPSHPHVNFYSDLTKCPCCNGEANSVLISLD